VDELLRRTADLAAEYLDSLPTRAVGSTADDAVLRKALGGPLPDGPVDAVEVITELAAAAEPGLVASAGPRFFGFVIGGSMPVALAADWLTAAWDQNAGLYAAGPAAAVAEDIAATWLLELLGLPSTASVGFVTGATMANFTGLAAARHAVFQRVGWDVEQDGLIGAPPVRVIAGDERHVTLDVALRYLGLGSARTEIVPVDDQGRMRADALRRLLDDGSSAPLIVCAQVGNVNTGAFDPVEEICAIVHDRGGWVHVDGAFGLWAGAAPAYRHLLPGVAQADSWSTDAHKWLNTPYDNGLAIVADPEAHAAAMSLAASYLIQGEAGQRDEYMWTPETSRRARGLPVYAALRSLGRTGVAELVDRCCRHARHFAEALGAEPGVTVINDVVLNQALIRFDDDDAMTQDVVRRVQLDGTCWLGGTIWQGRAAMRISVSNWSTSERDVDLSVAAILRCYRDARPR
jgi:glutamate/tyrosine decarboxylase-like PLP-dependent enzyme